MNEAKQTVPVPLGIILYLLLRVKSIMSVQCVNPYAYFFQGALLYFLKILEN